MNIATRILWIIHRKFQFTNAKRRFSIWAHSLCWKVGRDVFVTARFVLQFVDRRYCIRERLRTRCQRLAVILQSYAWRVYAKTDVLLLADIFGNFRDNCVASYGLDPAYYYTLPGFTWDAMLKHTRINFELFIDIDIVMFIKRGIRGDLNHCSNRYA